MKLIKIPKEILMGKKKKQIQNLLFLLLMKRLEINLNIIQKGSMLERKQLKK